MPVDRFKNQKKDRKRKFSSSTPSNSNTTSAVKPERLQKLLAQNGLGSRREIEAMIVAGHISVNNIIAKLGDRAGVGDKIRINGKIIQLRLSVQLPRILIYHKPEGEIVSVRDPQGRPSVFEKLPRTRTSKWIAIGRLDFNTSGLLIFTTDGALANRLMHPRYQMEREYAVRTIGELTAEQITRLTTGIELEDGLAKFDQLHDRGGEGVNRWYGVTLKEGRNREVRRMFKALGVTVSRLMRIRFGPIALPPRLKRGKWLELTTVEVEQLLMLID
ncbi:ribosomal large subunit pseudouridine synthase [Nitrosomonas stercoris]|uniref:Pseudouridine synthase n=1 Tax=Nitrosomonas stercoris TaxID=1444684 RepID=A0A4Y1YS72_9PROT|nr:ribosomal large subunit pseudouridine synthase [Nitrosomonas stercoris]